MNKWVSCKSIGYPMSDDEGIIAKKLWSFGSPVLGNYVMMEP